jgi:hypothetical protein
MTRKSSKSGLAGDLGVGTNQKSHSGIAPGGFTMEAQMYCR